MKINIKGFRLNKNGKPIILDDRSILLNEYNGILYKENREYFYYCGTYNGRFIYRY